MDSPHHDNPLPCDTGTKVFLKNEDELKELGNYINEMAAKMHDVFDEISARSDELRTIVSSIQESLVVLDKDGRIRTALGGS